MPDFRMSKTRPINRQHNDPIFSGFGYEKEPQVEEVQTTPSIIVVDIPKEEPVEISSIGNLIIPDDSGPITFSSTTEDTEYDPPQQPSPATTVLEQNDTSESPSVESPEGDDANV